MSKSQFNKSKPAVSKALILCILMIISSLANCNLENLRQEKDVQHTNLNNYFISPFETETNSTYGWGEVMTSTLGDSINGLSLSLDNSSIIVALAQSGFILPNGQSSTTSSSVSTLLIMKFDSNLSYVSNIHSDGVGSLNIRDASSNNHSIVVLVDFVANSGNSCGITVQSITITCEHYSGSRKTSAILVFDNNLILQNWAKVETHKGSISKLTIDSNDDIFFAATTDSWAKIWNKNNVNTGTYSYISTSQGCVVGTSAQRSNLVIGKLDNSGNVWGDIQTGTARFHSISDIKPDKNGGVFLAGGISSCNGGSAGYFDGISVNVNGEHTFVGQISNTGNWQKIEISSNQGFTQHRLHVNSQNPTEIFVIAADVDDAFSFMDYNSPSDSDFNYGKDFFMLKLDWSNSSYLDSIILGNSTLGSIQGLFVDSVLDDECFVISFRIQGFVKHQDYFLNNSAGRNYHCIDNNFDLDWSAHSDFYSDQSDRYFIKNQSHVGLFVPSLQSVHSYLDHLSYPVDGFGFLLMGSDHDMDDTANSADLDDDNDGLSDLYDECQLGELFTSILQTDRDQDGCRDSTEDFDDDGDGLEDSLDFCATGVMYWTRNSTTDYDNDGCYDPSEDFDDDNDGFDDFEDMCPRLNGNSTYPLEKGCPDDDGDGRANMTDPFPQDATEWKDTDQDGTGDNSDDYPLDATQIADSDGDGYGDNTFGNAGDSCPTIFGNSTIDVFGCEDDDGDGYSNGGDDFDNNPTQWMDSDGDGYGNNQSQGAIDPDMFPSDGTQWEDSDGDGYGDNPWGTTGDMFPNDPTRWQDSDGDGYDDAEDALPFDPTQWNDTDGDGFGDNSVGNAPDQFPSDPNEWFDTDLDGVGDNSDEFPYDPSQTNDSDGDGYGDNPLGNAADLFPSDPNEWFDADMDGYGDNSDDFPTNPTQWNDTDDDGYGDELGGLDGDEFPNDPLRWSDEDGDGYSDQQSDDAFENDGTQWNDTDGDSFGDNLDGNDPDEFPNDPLRWSDEDGDGYSDQQGDDAFENDGSQWNDTDGDGFGDNPNGTDPDEFVNDPNESQDTDGDGVGDNGDDFPYDPSQTVDADNDGYGDNPNGINGDQFPGDSLRWSDSDGDGYSDQQVDDSFVNDGSQWNDSDGDGYGDNPNGTRADLFPTDANEWFDTDGDGYGNNGDEFPNDATQWNDTDGDGYGDNKYGTLGDHFPNDSTRWQDTDEDGYANEDDAFVNDATQWNDTDGDGYGDNQDGQRSDQFPNDANEWYDTDGDGYGDNSDAFSSDGTQWNDTDGDGYGDNKYGTLGDHFPTDSSRWKDSDEDGYADEDDAFVNDATQWNDTDGDGYGDNPAGNNADTFPDDNTEWQDSDNDGVGNNGDAFPFDPTQSVDSDGDGYGDNQTGTNPDLFPDSAQDWGDADGDGYSDLTDAFPNDPTQYIDTDGDGYGDNAEGNLADLFPTDKTEWFDSDSDGVGDNLDAFAFDPTQTTDRDGDGMGDNPMGIGADKFPDDPIQWGDIDGDGYGDNPTGNYSDAFITDATQWSDIDGDGYGDNPTGRLYDQFPNDPTQWLDEDGDNLGDNQNGNNPDPYLDDFDNDGFNDSIDILPKLYSPGDLDADGCLDDDDAFIENPLECIDTDGDGVGNNADSDDDGDGWTDADEDRLGTDSLSASQQPVDSFEIVIPGTAVGLGAWDLIGIFGGVPLFAWLAFGFSTRNGRCQRYESMLREANSRDELELIALQWEYSLMLRMLGPHQGIRLERLRAELDDSFEKMEDTEPMQIGNQQDSIIEREDKVIPPITAESSIIVPDKDKPADSTDDEGYEWLKDESGIDWYRAAGSGDEWAKFES